MSKRRDTRYPHAFSKGRGVAFVTEGSWRPQAPCMIQAGSLAGPAPGPPPEDGAMQPAALKPRSGSAGKALALKQRSGSANKTSALKPPPGDSAKKTSPPDPRRWALLRVSPTVADLYRSHVGLAVICADCLHGVGHRNPGLPDRFRREWGLTLLELEKRCRCEMCGARNARVYPWWGESGGALGLEGAMGDGR